MSKSFEAEKFVHFLLNEGAKHACDESSDAFTQCANIPDFFDKQKFERYTFSICSLSSKNFTLSNIFKRYRGHLVFFISAAI